ncbi:hypothetical protein [Aminobacter sp. HY435]|uniref:hypothetical protein n=1 Tax=Aminobacter sp. HY435 TaxID=2970917 RepID=UPI0022B9A035|nr:hypothetical protein [Aminobacter sp. HY435]
MTRRRSSLGFLGMFGRSGDLRQLDAALRAVDLHPALVPEGVKLTIVNLMKDHSPGEPPAHAYPIVAQLFGYCVSGSDAFAQANGGDIATDVERRIESALDTDDSFDAQIVLLTLHARLINPDVVARFGLSSEQS